MVDAITIDGALQRARRALRPSRTASLDGQLMLAHVFDISRAAVLAHGDRILSAHELDRFEELVARRVTGEPVAYLTGSVEWYGDRFLVTPDVLVPRPETELLLERALTMMEPRPSPFMVDIGTGSGVLAIELAKHIPRARVLAVDVSPAALAVARRNIVAHGVAGRVETRTGNLLDPIDDKPDLIVANLPYLSDEMMNTLDRDVRREPVLALHGGTTGLELYSALLHQVASRGWDCSILFEIDPHQSAVSVELVRTFTPGRTVSVEPDYAGHDRIVVVGAGA